MTDAALTPPATSLRQTVEARLKKRHAQEMRFRLYGRLAIVVALFACVLIFTFLVRVVGVVGTSMLNTLRTRASK